MPRNSVAKWPDSGATSSTRGCTVLDILLEAAASVAERRDEAARPRSLAHSRLPTITVVDAERQARMREPGARDQLDKRR